MSKSQTAPDIARLEARIPRHIYELMQRAAELQGQTLTGYLLATAGESARQIVENAEILKLSRMDQIRFAQSLIDPPAPTDRLIAAVRLHKARVTER